MRVIKFSYTCENCEKKTDKFFKSSSGTIVCPDCSGLAKITFSSASKTRGGTSRTTYSRSMGVHPDQIPGMEKRFPGRKYAPDGRLEVNGYNHQKKLAKEHNMVID